LKQRLQGKVIRLRKKDERDELAAFIAENPEPWIVTFSPPSIMDAALQYEDLMQLCTMEATSYHDDGRTIIFMNESGTTCIGFEKIKLNFEKKINGEGCKAIAFYYAKAAEPDLDKEGLDWPCWILTVSTVKKCYW
jgi:hypothetical protein